MIIANFHEIYNFLSKNHENKNIDFNNFKSNYIKILQTMLPVLPHLVNECLYIIDKNFSFSWPEVDKKYLEKKTNTIVLQINGKKRGIINCKKDILERDLIKM